MTKKLSLHNRFLFLAPVFTSGVLLSFSAAAADDANTIAPDELVVSATRTPSRFSEIGSSVSVILAADIEARQYSFTADALRDAAGVSVARNSAFGGFASARIRGASSGQTLIVIDGIVVNDPSAPAGGFNFANLDVADIDRIEILRGPQSLLYGADAIGGVISIFTKAESSSTTAFLEGGSFGTQHGGGTIAAASDKAFGRLTISGIRTNGISRAAAGSEKDGFHSVSGSLKAGADLSEVWTTQIFARYGDAHAEIDGFPAPFFALADTDGTEDTEDYAIAGRLSHHHNKFNGAFTVSYNRINRRNQEGGFETFRGEGERLSTDYIGSLALFNWVSITGGAEFEQTSVVVSGIDESAENGAAFGLLEVKPAPGLSLSAGARHDEFSDFDGATTARIAAAWSLGENTVIRGSWGQGFRAPTLFELNFDQFGFIPNPDLHPERANGFDIGVKQRFGDENSHLTVKAAFFHQRVKDQIDFDFAGSGFFNIDRTRSRGVEVEADWRANDWLSASANYSLTAAVDSTTGAPLLRQPKHSGTAIITVTPIEKLTLSTSIIINGRESDFPAPNDAFLRVDLRAAYAVSKKLELYGRVENATDAHYQDVSGFGEPGLSAFGGARVRL